MSTTALPSTSLQLLAEDFATGLVGVLGVTIFRSDGTVAAARRTSGITEFDSAGIYSTTIITPATPGTYFVSWDDGAGIRTTEDLTITTAPVAPPPPSETTTGPCTPWITIDDLACTPTDPPAGSLQAAIDAATEMLYEASGRRYRGSCSLTVRPCRQGWQSCWTQALTPTTIISSSGVLDDVGDGGGAWDTCGCSWRPQVLLAGNPVRSITSVLIDGDVLAEDAYRLEPGGRLIRIDGGLWPFCQDMRAEPGAPGTFVVEYVWGRDVPAAGRQAAAELACELWGALHDVDVCRLPANVTELVRQGVTIRRAVQAFNLANGATGLASVDAFLGMHAGRPRRPSVVYSPDLEPFPRRVL